jgi:hypothetical protein
VIGTIAPDRPLTVLDLCDRCGAQAYVRVLLLQGELLFCAHHGREFSKGLASVALVILDETERLNELEATGKRPDRR